MEVKPVVESIVVPWDDRFRIANEILGNRPWDELQACHPRRHATLPGMYAKSVKVTPMIVGTLSTAGWRANGNDPSKPFFIQYNHASIEIEYGELLWPELETA